MSKSASLYAIFEIEVKVAYARESDIHELFQYHEVISGSR